MLFSWCPLEYVLSAVVKVPELYHNYATLQKDNVWKIVLNWWDLDIQRFPFPPIIMILQKCLRLIYFWIKLLWKKKCWFQFVEKKHNENVGEMFFNHPKILQPMNYCKEAQTAECLLNVFYYRASYVIIVLANCS